MGIRIPPTVACVFLAAGGCAPARLEPLVGKGDGPAAASGYVAGVFSSDRGSGFAFVLADDAGREYRMPFGDGKALVPREQQLAMIPVPPGTYSVRFWQACALNHEVIRTVAIAPANPLARSFEVRRGQVVVLGSFATTTTHSFGQIDWTVEQRQLAASHVEAAILREYPAFRAAPVSCLLCDVVPTGEPEARR